MSALHAGAVMAPMAAAAVTGAVAVTAAVLLAGHWYRARRRRARRRHRLVRRAEESIARAEALSEIAALLALHPDDPLLPRRLHRDCEALLDASDALARDALGLGLRRAVKDLRESLLLLDAEVSRAETIFVPDAPKDGDKRSFFVRRLAERCAELLLAARFLAIVASVEPT
jgi:hypothetical protein